MPIFKIVYSSPGTTSYVPLIADINARDEEHARELFKDEFPEDKIIRFLPFDEASTAS